MNTYFKILFIYYFYFLYRGNIPKNPSWILSIPGNVTFEIEMHSNLWHPNDGATIDNSRFKFHSKIVASCSLIPFGDLLGHSAPLSVT